MKNHYIILRLKILLSIIIKGKVSMLKVLNATYCFFACLLRLKKSAKFPFIINFELCNECNMNCLFCRTCEGGIYDQNPNSDSSIPKGRMPYEVFTAIIDQVQNHLLMAVLYANGEPLLYRDLSKAIKYTSQRCIATMISTNGILLNKKNIAELLNSGLDFIKIAVSGFNQKIYQIQHRKGNVELVKDNIRTLAHLNRQSRHKLIIMVDYILYKYNEHELIFAKQFCAELGIIFNVRPGNLRNLEDEQSSLEPKASNPLIGLCDWPWKVMMVDWNGNLLPCCDYALWSGSKPYAKFEKEKTIIADIWNGKEIIENRLIHIKKGRKAIPVCAQCSRRGSAFKY